MDAKRVIWIVGGLIIALCVALVGVALFSIQRKQKEENSARTEAARKARWPEKSESTNDQTKAEKKESEFSDLETLAK
jgi:beta-lactamase regulating signal transducer with metallopeptidase domain